MAINTRQKQILNTMGIPVWTARREIAGQKAVEADLPEEVPGNSPSNNLDNNQPLQDDNWQLLQQEVAECTACELHKSRTKTVFGTGKQQAKLMIIGEAPGEQEDLKGEPFVGPAGQMLNQMLLALGVAREDIFITNILKCAPPGERKPLSVEVETCSAFVLRQIALVKPKVIFCLGAVSAKKLLNSTDRIGNLRGQVLIHSETSIPLVATYHPAYLLRKPTEKRAVWSDLLLLKKLLAESE